MIEKNLALESESQGSTLSLITEGVQASKLWFHHYTMMTPNTSGHCLHILAAWAIWAPEAPHLLAALCQLWIIQENTWLLLCLCLRMRKLVNISEHPKRATTCLIRSQLFSKLPRTASVRQGNVVRQTDMFSLQMLCSFTNPPRPTQKPLLPKFQIFLHWSEIHNWCCIRYFINVNNMRYKKSISIKLETNLLKINKT